MSRLLTIQSGPLDTVSRGGTTTVARLSSSVKFSESNSQDCLVVLVQTLTSAWWITGTGRAKAVASISKGATSATVPISPATNWPRIITPARISTSVRPTTGDAPTFVWTRLEALFASARTAFIWPTTGRLAKVTVFPLLKNVSQCLFQDVLASCEICVTVLSFCL